MREFNVKLQSINDVKAFVTASSMMSCDIDVLSGRYLVDAKSIMGLFSLDLANSVTVQVHGNDEAANAFKESISDLLVDEA